MENSILSAEYAKREENILFEGEHKGINYFITENDYERREISHTPEEAPKFAANQMLLLEILNKHYGNRPSAGIPKEAGYSRVYEVPIQKPYVNENKVGRNAPCPCGSGKKSKKCCH